MSSHRKRRAESEEVAHKKKPRNGDSDDFNASEDEDGTGSEFDDGEGENNDG
ncbi:hypothetical protein BJV78DRAFT_1285704 [Lactifluus subvellereus]|nr:hypothetical protein BJV78DRAFT_1285704 [Lactifluus subvellereus]